MSLQVYNKTDPPMSVIVDNDTYFDGHTELDSGDTCAGVLKVIDKAVYNTPARLSEEIHHWVLCINSI